MSAKFLGRLFMVMQTNDDGVPLTNRSGRQLWALCKSFGYQSDVGGAITVPEGFVTDLSSIPRLPVVYVSLNGVSDEPGVIHDYLYSTGTLSRKTADEVLREACTLIGLAPWKVAAIYAGVRAFGGSHYGPSS